MKCLIELTIKELEEIIMSAWIDGWRSKDHQNDDRKRIYSERILKGIIKGE